MTPRRIDLRTYPRLAHFQYFRTLACPYAGLTVNADITGVPETLRAADLPFFLPLLHCAVNAANDVPALRQRIRGEGIVEYDTCPSSHTVAKPDGTYCYCLLDCRGSLTDFLPYAMAAQAAALEHGSLEESDTEALLFVSSVPWLSYTAIVQPTPYPADSNPRITFGKAFRQEGKTLLPVSILCNHALVDGRQIADFYQALDRHIDDLRNNAKGALL